MAKLSPNTHLSGSVIPAWLGYSQWDSPYEIIDRAKDAVKGIQPAPLDSLPADIGTAVEPIILKRGLSMLGFHFDEMINHTENGEPAAKKHPEMELYYSDDGLITLPKPKKIYSNEGQGITVMNQDGEITLDGLVILEAKYTTVPEKPNDPPLHRGPLQLQAGMMCHDAKFGILFTCYAGRKITVHIFERHEAAVKQITESVAEFEQHMANGTYPAPKTAEEMAQFYTEPVEEPIELDPDLIDSVLSIDDANESIKIDQTMKDTHGQYLMGAMGNHTKATIVDNETGIAYNVAWPFRRTKAKPAECCPSCNHELKPAVPESEARQKTVTVKRVK